MRILYLTPRINNEGGVARILSVKTNLLIENFGYEVAIATQNQGNTPLFFDFNSQIQLFDIELKGSIFQRLIAYKKKVQSILKNYNPDVVVVTDNGLKGYGFKYLVQCHKPTLFEVHGSKYNVQHPTDNSWKKIGFRMQVLLREIGLKKFDSVVFLSNESQQQWNVKQFEIIPNINWIETTPRSSFHNKIALCVARNSYEKGLDRLLLAWKQIHKQQPDWKLRLITEKEGFYDINAMLASHAIEDSVKQIASVKDISQHYQESSLFLMTSYNEGMPMVLIEALSFGLPIVAFDCPIGPRSIIVQGETGYLIENGNSEEWVSKAISLMKDENLRHTMGEKAQLHSQKYQSQPIIEKWDQLLKKMIR